LIVGYLKVKTELSALAKKGISTPITTAPVKQEEVKVTEPVGATPPVVQEERKKTRKEIRKEKEAAEKKAVADENINTNPEKETPVAETSKTVSGKSTGGPGFKKLYETQIKNTETTEVTGSAGVFKSTSGWTDNKYYCLYSDASAGTIIKITNTANGKFVFAKVVDNIPDIKQNEGLVIVISNAAADALDTADANFNCTINYAK
jgi:rare lipoprotein A (peptidoglycan hydrolase)